MEIEKLIKMANQIGDFFEAYPDAELAKKTSLITLSGSGIRS